MQGHQIQTSKTEESPCAGVAAGRRSKDISTKKPHKAALQSLSDITKRLSCSSVVSDILDSDQGSQTTENSVLELNQTLSSLTETCTTPNSLHLQK